MFDGFAKIYALTDRNNVPFYVGCTVQELMTRRSGHITEASKGYWYGNAIKNEKIRSLQFKIRVRLLFLIDVKAETKWIAQRSCRSFERYWIKRLLSEGYELCNRVHGNIPWKPGDKLRMIKKAQTENNNISNVTQISSHTNPSRE